MRLGNEAGIHCEQEEVIRVTEQLEFEQIPVPVIGRQVEVTRGYVSCPKLFPRGRERWIICGC